MKFKILAGMLFIGALALSSCGKDEQRCTTCTTTLNSVEVKVCELDNGNAEVSGIDTKVDYDTYVATLKLAGTCE